MKRTPQGRGKIRGATGKGGAKRPAGRGSSIQGERQNARGGNAGANQGGASRGASRLEPSHVRDALKKDQKRERPGGISRG